MTEPPRIKGRAPITLGDKVSRIVQSLAKGSVADAEPARQQTAELALVPDEIVARALSEWQDRTFYLPAELLSEPAWGILLELLLAEIQGRKASLSRIRKVSGVPASTADRWLKVLERHAFVLRSADRLQADDDIVSLSRRGSSTLRRYFHEVVQAGGTATAAPTRRANNRP